MPKVIEIQKNLSTHTKVFYLLLVLCISLQLITQAQMRIIDSTRHLLRSGTEPEWKEFSSMTSKKELILFFNVSKISEHTLSLRQEDVKQNWNILLNDHQVGLLCTDGNPMRTYYKLLPERLKSGENKLTIKAGTTIPDDILITDISIDERPHDTAMNEAFIDIEVTDRNTKTNIPARITIVDEKTILQTTATRPSAELAIRSGFIYTGNGKVRVLLPRGKYTIYAGRGFEYNIDSVTIDIKAGQQLSKKLLIHREVNTDGWVSADTHIHTVTHSGHGDATEVERALTIAGEGIEMPIITEHNKIPDFSTTIKSLKLDSFYTTVAGNEMTTAVGHFNVFPLNPKDNLPDHRVTNWKSISDNLPIGNKTIIILNHGRDIHNGFRPFDPTRHISIAGSNLDKWKLPANAMEVVNSGALQNDPLRLFHDWFGLLNRGLSITPIGASDSHDVSRYLVGQARTYIQAKDTKPGMINVQEVVNSMIQGRVMISFGLLPKITVNKKFGPGDVAPAARETIIDVEVLGPSWITAERVSLYANGIKIREEKILKGTAGGIKWKGQWKLPRQKTDMFLVTIVEGDGKYLPFWPIVKPFQPVSNNWKPYTIGSSGAIWIDADGNGKANSAYEYANKLLGIFQKDFVKLFKELSLYDESVTIQVAAILQENGVDLSSRAFVSALADAVPTVKNGFDKFSKEWLKSKTFAK